MLSRHHRFTVLVTRPLKGKQIAFARSMGINPIIRPTLKFEFPEYWDKILGSFNPHPKQGYVFTSTNAVKALEELRKNGLQFLDDQPMYAVGPKTQDALKELGIDASIPHQHDGSHLADHIIEEDKAQRVIYFRGNRSRSELRNKLEDAGIDVEELEVYRTELQTIDIPEHNFDGVLFYSPSAVEAFTKSGGFERDIPFYFAIGPTTAGALEEHVEDEDRIIVSNQPKTLTLLQTVSMTLRNAFETKDNADE